MTTAVRDPALEQWLDDHHITWHLNPNLPLDQVDHLAGLANQARHQTLHEDTVDRYAADMANGAVFPPIVVRPGDTGWIPVGGNHRIAGAHRASRATLAAYQLDAIDELNARLLAVEDNRRHGLPLTDPERLDHALALIDRDDWSINQAAAAAGIAPHKVTKYLATRRSRLRAARMGVRGLNALSDSSLAHLDRLADDRAFTLAARAMVDGHILASEIGALTGKANNSGNPLRYLDDTVVSLRQRVRRASGHPVSAAKAPRVRFIHDLEGLLAYDVDAIVADTATPTQRHQLADEITATAKMLHAIYTRVSPTRSRPGAA